MKIFSTNQTHAAQGLKGPHTAKAPTAKGPTQKPDQLELSSEALKASEMSEALDIRALEGIKPSDGGIRTELVNRLRGQIESGTYDSPDKASAAIDNLLDLLG